MTRLAPADSWFLFESRIKTDMFLVYAFAGTPQNLAEAVDEVLRRARDCPEFGLRVSADRAYPDWVPGDVEAHQIVVHAAGEDWSECLNRMGRWIQNEQLDARRALWRMHVFPGMQGVPSATGPSTVAVLQINHAFADGRRSSILAGILFGRAGVVMPAVSAPRGGNALVRNAMALRWRRRLARATRAGLVPPPPTPVPALSINTAPGGAAVLRTLVRRRSEMPQYSVTIGALIAVSEALSGYLEARGEDTSRLTALVPMAVPGMRDSRNRQVAEFVHLFPDVRSRDERAALIAADLEERRRRRRHPSFAADLRALAALPGPTLRWVSTRSLPESTTRFANTSLSSVYRGAADLSFGACPVIMTAGYPYLTPTLGLAHGVHGIGDTVAISVHTAASVMKDVDEYMDRLDSSLRP